MKRSGRSVADASRVIEIDDVLVPTMVVGLERRAERAEDLALDLLLLGRGFDHQIAIGELVQRFCRADAIEGGLPLVVGDALAADLARQIAADGGKPLGNALGDDVVEQHVETRERADMGDAAAHLAGTDHADLADGKRRRLGASAARHRPLLHFDHLRLPSSTIRTSAACRFAQRPRFSSSWASSGKA